MNKIFKVKRNLAGQSVVCSEISKSHNAIATKAIAAVVLAVAANVAVAANTTNATAYILGDENTVSANLQAEYKPSAIVGNNNTLAYENENVTGNDLIVGSSNTLTDTRQNIVSGHHNTVANGGQNFILGDNNKTTNSWQNTVLGSAAVKELKDSGSNTISGSGSISADTVYGNNFITVESPSAASNLKIINRSVIAGNALKANQVFNSFIYSSAASNNTSEYYQTTNSVSLGTSNAMFGVEGGTQFGSHNKMGGTDIQSTQEAIKNEEVIKPSGYIVQIGDFNTYQAPSGDNVTAADASNIVQIGLHTNVSGHGNIAIGTYSSAGVANSTVEHPWQQQIDENNLPYRKNVSSYNTAMGYGAAAVGNGSTAIGLYTAAVGLGSTAIGVGLEEPEPSITYAAGRSSLAIGGQTGLQASSAVAIGVNSFADKADSVALGSNSRTDTDAGAVGYLADGKTDAVWQATKAAVSIGDVEKGITRQITNLAAGTQDTDAVNVAQLKAAVFGTFTTVDAGDGIEVKKSEADNGGSLYTVSLSKETKDRLMAVSNNQAQNDAKNSQQDDAINANKTAIAENSTAITNLGNVVATKADKSYVDTQNQAQDVVIASKADKTYVDAQDAVLVNRIDMLGGSMNSRFGAMQQHINIVEDKLQAGIAGSNASASLPQVRGNGKSMMAFGLGGFQDKGALAIGYSRSSDSGRTVFKAHLNADNEKQVGGGLGLGFEW